MKCLPSPRVCCVLAVAVSFGASKAIAGPLSAFEKNVEALNQSVLMAGSMLVQSFGPSPALLSFSGSFLDSSWNASMGGLYADMPVDLLFSGLFNTALDQGSFTSSGTVGASTWTGAGTWNFTDPAPLTVAMQGDSDAAITAFGLTLLPDKHYTKIITEKMVGNYLVRTDTGQWQTTQNGIPVGVPEVVEDSISQIPKDGPQIATATVSLSNDRILLQETANFDNGSVTGTLSVPEPSTLLLLMAGLWGVLVLKLRQPCTSGKR